jgi:serine phosphatase RsbU (regulator of sigma subunit)
MTPFTNHKVILDKGDMIILSSDGYADQFGGPKGKKLMYKPFKKLMLENMDKPLDNQSRLLDEAFENWRGNHEQVDDVCVIGVRV